ncbi:Heat_shock protein 70 [Hexamita inflata]|uniref:Heat shock protein 70 n=1 Tax=Hexamita inflata TaxID=28002 RepID=A0AA86TM73_9EUKA|nr:Heat shock protein 70 [Hexamita inflata]
MLSLLISIQFDAIVDLGSATFQVGHLRKQSAGNLIDAIINTESKRQSPTIIAYDGIQFYAGEHAQAYFKKNQGPIFRRFTNDLLEPLSNFVNDKQTPEIENIKGYQTVVLITALMNHITHMIGGNESIDLTLIHSPSWDVGELQGFKQAVEELPNVKLFMTLPTPAAVAITHFSSRMKEYDFKKGQQVIVIDTGASTTEVSLLNAVQNGNETEIHLIANKEFRAGGDHISKCIQDNFVTPKIPNYSEKNLKLVKRVEDAVEKAKIVLSAQNTAKLVIESALGQYKDLVLQITKENVEFCTETIFNSSNVNKLTTILNHVQLDSAPMFLFYGGSSRIPKLTNIFETAFNASIQKTVNLDEGAIYGGGLVAANKIPGFKLVNKFVVLDEQKPELKLNEEKVIKLNPNQKTEFELKMKFELGEFNVSEEKFMVTVVNETTYYEKDEKGDKKKKTSQNLNTVDVTYSKISHKGMKLEFQADVGEEEPLFVYTCELQTADLDSQSIIKKYEPKKGGMGVPAKKMTEIKADTKKYTDTHTQVMEGLTKYTENEDYRSKNEPKLFLNFSTDATAMPTLVNATLQIINTETKKAENSGVLFTPTCTYKYGKRMVDSKTVKEAAKIVFASNAVMDKRSLFDNAYNEIETILINSEDFVQKYPAAEVSEGDHLFYKNESEALETAIQNARTHIQNLPSMKQCTEPECFDDRIAELTKLLKNIQNIHNQVTTRAETKECSSLTQTKFKSALKALQKSLEQANNFTNNLTQFKETMETCVMIRALEIDDEIIPMTGEEENDVQKMKKLRKTTDKKASKSEQDQAYFSDLYYLYSLQNANITETDELSAYFTKGMLKKLKKANSDCSFLNSTYGNMQKKISQNNQKEFEEFQAKFEAEFQNRPETTCEEISNKTKNVEKEQQELDKKVKDVRSETDRSRISQTLEQLYKQSKDYRRQMNLVNAIKENAANSVELIQDEMKLNVTMADVAKINDKLQTKLEKVDVDGLDKLIEDLKEAFKANQTQDTNKEDL